MSSITKFIVNTPDYFAAYTDANTIRFGLVGSNCFEIDINHRAAPGVECCTTSDDVEIVFDNFMSGVFGEFKYYEIANR